MAARVLLRDRPHRAVALATSSHILTFRHTSSSKSTNASSTSLNTQLASSGPSATSGASRCIVELESLGTLDLREYRTLSHSVYGTLGLITVDEDVFLCVVSGATKAAQVRPGETVNRILSVDFYCLNRSDQERFLQDDLGNYDSDGLDQDGQHNAQHAGRRDQDVQHPCLALKTLLNGGSFYYSVDFDLTNRIQDRTEDATTTDFDVFDKGYLWNSYMIRPLIDFRSRLSNSEKMELDSTRLLTLAIRGFALTYSIPASSSPARTVKTGLPSTITIISRLSCKRAGTRFNARGIDDDGNVANFVETETIFWSPSGICFSYVQIRGSIPLFWEQAPGLLPGQQKIQITRSPQATQPAFDKHFEELEKKYSTIHIVNLLSNERQGEVELSQRYRAHVARSSLNDRHDGDAPSDHRLLQETDYDFHAETRGVAGYEAASMIRRYIEGSAEGFGYCLVEQVEDSGYHQVLGDQHTAHSAMVLQQQGIFRTNCLDCLDRTNLVQTIISQMAFEVFLEHRAERITPDLAARHGSLWADNGDALSKIYAGTGALKSSFTRTGKMTLAGALADVRKSATRIYINNFEDKSRQTTMDFLLGRLLGQIPVYIFDPINDLVMAELDRRSAEFTSTREISIWTGTLNLNGRADGLQADLSAWFYPPSEKPSHDSNIVAVGFQEIVELSPQQIMSTEPTQRQTWEKAVKKTLNEHSQLHGLEQYVLLRGGQLVGASLSIFIKKSLLSHVKNVEASLKKTGMSGMAGNKGAVAIRMDVDNTSLCFVTAHLAAGFANYVERNRDYQTIREGLRFQRNRSIDSHDSVIWLGDFNYRIGLAAERTKSLIAAGELEKLYENDQLNLQMVAGLTFPFYSEARISFPPTYKYDLGNDNYDSSEKARIPAWCDRILRKGDRLRQTTYNHVPTFRFSDHRPVYAHFICTVEIVDEKHKNRLNTELYEQRRAAVGSIATNADSDEDLIGYESIEPGLPPASSDRRKWWLDYSKGDQHTDPSVRLRRRRETATNMLKGLPARSAIRPPADTLIPNPSRPSNPFSSTTQSDWAKGQLHGGSQMTVLTSPNNIANLHSGLSSPASGASPGPPLPRRTIMQDHGDALLRKPSAASTVSRKPAPPVVPVKPVNLGGFNTTSGETAQSTIAGGLFIDAGGARGGKPPPPRPRGTSTKVARSLLDDDNHGAPAKLVRNKNVMDEDDNDSDQSQSLSGWAPLKPS